MALQSGILKYKENEVHCLRLGKGPKLLIAFHGFGNDADIYIPLAAALSEEYTVVSIDLPGHGKTKWKSKHFLKKDLMAIIQGVKNDFNADKITLAGYSLGGRICLNIIEQQPNWIEKAVLLASDGLQKNIWYSIATRNLFGKMVFRKMMDNPEQWLNRVDWLRKYKIIDESRFKFAKLNLTHEGVRHQLSYVWPVTSKLVTNTALVKWNINKHKIDTHVFMGRHDRIFPPVQGERFIRNLKTAQLHVLDTGHNFLTEEVLPEIVAVFK
jgi:pimeloyl-ACP methyl ester carboxylesterase